MLNLNLRLLAVFAMHIWVVQSQYVIKQEEPKPYCSFFNNRAPEPQPGLKNCTWFKDNSCCQQQEIAATFGRVKPLKGASPSCQKYINYLMCYICKPDQHLYYQNERLTVCREFCDSLYEACNSAVLKGSVIKGLYNNGTEFCGSRRFKVSEERCFTFDVTLDSTSSSRDLRVLPLLLLVSAYLSLRFTGVVSTKMNVLLSLSVLLFSVLFGDCRVTSMDVKALALKVSQELNSLGEVGLQYRELQKLYNDADYTTEIINGTQKVLEIRDRLVSFFTNKRILAEDLAAKAQKLHATFILNGEQELLRDENLGHMKELPLAQYLDTDLLNRLPLDLMTFDSLFQRAILANYSAVKIPDEVSRSNEKVIETAVWTSRLDAMFQENMATNPHIRWQYFASTTGLHRTFPAAEWPRNFIGFHDDYDPRMRPWYIAATSGPKNMVIIIDGSLSMAEDMRLDRAKKVAINLLSTLSKQDYVNVIVSKSAFWTVKGEFRNTTCAVLHCEDTSLVTATGNHRKELQAEIEDINAEGGSNHTEAFLLAYQLLKAHSDDHCPNIIVFITDGQQNDGENRCSKGYYRYHYDKKKSFVPGKRCFYPSEEVLDRVANHQVVEPARHFTFLVKENADSSRGLLPGLLACRHGGTMATVANNTGILHQMSPYFTFLGGSLGARNAVWSSPYVDSSLLGLMTTVAVPVFSNLTDELLGVVGVDVLLSHLANEIRHSLWGSVYAFLVDAKDGSAILHPFTKPLTELADYPSFIPITYLETSDGLPRDFEKVLEGIKNKVVGDVKITKDARRATSKHDAFTWQPLEYSHYFFADIPESDFVLVFHLTPSDEIFEHPFDPEGSWKSFVHEMHKYQEYDPAAYADLSPQEYSHTYSGLLVSMKHSVVSLAPRSFCFPSLYLEEGKPNFIDIDHYINLDSASTDHQCPHGEFRSETRPDVKLTSVMEDFWKKRPTNISNKVTWTYIGTQSGVFRIYPGVQMTRNYDPTQRPWYRIAEANKGQLAISSPYKDNQHSDGSHVLTLSHTVHKGQPLLPPDCTVPKRDYGCPCAEFIECRSNFCYHGSCADKSIQAVVAMDIAYNDFSLYIMEIFSRVETVGKKCGESYTCGKPPKSCTVKCHLVDDSGDFVTHPSLDEMVVNDEGQAVSMASHYGHIMQDLLLKKVFNQKSRVDFQATCRISQSIPEPLVLMTSTNVDEEPGPTPAFQNEYSCTKRVVYYSANTTHLESVGGLVAGSLKDDPCSDGNFFFTPVLRTNLFLLVLYDYLDLSGNLFNVNCVLSNKVHAPVSVKVAQQGCQKHSLFNVQPSQDDRVCYPPKAVDLDCGYNTSTSFVALQFLITSVVLMSFSLL